MWENIWLFGGRGTKSLNAADKRGKRQNITDLSELCFNKTPKRYSLPRWFVKTTTVSLRVYSQANSKVFGHWFNYIHTLNQLKRHRMTYVLYVLYLVDPFIIARIIPISLQLLLPSNLFLSLSDDLFRLFWF